MKNRLQKQAGHIRSYKVKKWFFITLLFLIGIRALLPELIQYKVNKSLKSNLSDLTGHIDDVSMTLFGGSYKFHGLLIRKVNSSGLPMLMIKEIKFNLNRRMLFIGKLVLDITIDDALLNFIASKDPDKDQTDVIKKEQDSVLKTVKELLPLSVENLRISNFTINYEDQDLKGMENTALYLDSISVENILDPEKRSTNLSAVRGRGSINRSGKFNFDGGANFLKTPIPIDLRFGLDRLDLSTLNKLLIAYVPVNLTRGFLSLRCGFQGTLENGEGYARTYIDSLKVLKLDQKYESGRHFAIEMISGLMNWVVQVASNDRLAFELPFQFKSGELKLDASAAFFDSLENMGEELPLKYKEAKARK